MVLSLLLLYSVGASAAPATTRSVASDPPVRVWFNSDGDYQYGDRRRSLTSRSRSWSDGPRRVCAGLRRRLRSRRRDLHGITRAALRRFGRSVRMGRLVGSLVP